MLTGEAEQSSETLAPEYCLKKLPMSFACPELRPAQAPCSLPMSCEFQAATKLLSAACTSSSCDLLGGRLLPPPPPPPPPPELTTGLGSTIMVTGAVLTSPPPLAVSM